jgi:hypothetical protein
LYNLCASSQLGCRYGLLLVSRITGQVDLPRPTIPLQKYSDPREGKTSCIVPYGGERTKSETRKQKVEFGKEIENTQDAGLPDTNRRDPHKPGESPALRGQRESRSLAPRWARSRNSIRDAQSADDRRGGGGRMKAKRREISLCAGRPFRRSETEGKSRPAPFEMTVGGVGGYVGAEAPTPKRARRCGGGRGTLCRARRESGIT